MKRGIALLFICIALFAAISQARSVVDTNNQQQKDSSVSSSSQGTKNPDFFGWWRLRRFWFWWWVVHHHKGSLAPHSAPSKGAVEFEVPSDIGDHNINDVGVVEIEKCWSRLAEVDNCVDDIMGSFTSGNIEIKPACCSVIKKLKSNSCLEKTIGGLNNPRFTTAVTDHCSAM